MAPPSLSSSSDLAPTPSSLGALLILFSPDCFRLNRSRLLLASGEGVPPSALLRHRDHSLVAGVAVGNRAAE